MTLPRAAATVSDPRWSAFRGVFSLLLEAHEQAADVARDPWDFSVGVAELRLAGARDSSLRWLCCQGWLRMAAELPVRGGSSRRFRPEGLSIGRTTCAVLTDAGVRVARSVFPSTECLQGAADHAPAPHWDDAAGELYFSGRLIKRFRFRAPNQALVLAVFEEEGWPPRIDDPLPPHCDQDPKRRLLDTIKCLNRRQENRLLRFHGDGSGRGVRWRVVERARVS